VSGTLAAELKRLAADRLGFDLVGVTTADPLARGQQLREWLADGLYGEMAYLFQTGEARTDPSHLLPGARAVVCVALSYHDSPEPSDPSAGPRRAVVARYARRRDYHNVIRSRLVALGQFLEQRRPGTRWRVAVDTAPLLEKELAERAGLGWVGKNTLLINRRLGSELLLGELVTDAPLEPDPPGSPHCGRCRECMKACPSGALRAPFTLDARRCTAYLTIEHRGPLPIEFARTIPPHLAGCDRCQAACPWNRHAQPSCSALFPTRPQLMALDLAVLADLDEKGWRRLVAGTPLRRLGFTRFRRNLALLLPDRQQSALTFAEAGTIKTAPGGSEGPCGGVRPRRRQRGVDI